jgi:FKBP12-rapamycin complex-associated protein
MLAIYNNDFEDAKLKIKTARSLIEPALTSLWHESYSRAYPHVVQLQLLSELEEVVLFKRVTEAGDDAQKMKIQKAWERRLLGCQ